MNEENHLPSDLPPLEQAKEPEPSASPAADEAVTAFPREVSAEALRDDDDHVAELASLVPAVEIALTETAPVSKPTPRVPHPGFWWAIVWCIGMLIVAQFIPAILVAFLLAFVYMIQDGFRGGLERLGDLQSSQTYMMGALGLSQLMLLLVSVLALRLFAGKDWMRQVALRRPALLHLALALIGWPALSLSSAAVYGALQQELPGLAYLPSYMVTGCAVAGIVGGAWLAVRVSTGRDWTQDLARSAPSAQVVLSGLGVFMVLILTVQVYEFVRPYLPSIRPFETLQQKGGIMEEIVKGMRQWPAGLAVLIVGVGPGLAEELWCRGFLGRGLLGRHGVVMGVVLTSFFFGAIHVDPHQGTMAALMGLALHFAYVTSRSLWVPMLLHFLNNSLAVVADKLPDPLKSQLEHAEVAPDRIDPLVYVAAALLLVAVGWALYASRTRLVRVDGSDEPPWQPPFPGVAHPPVGSGTAVRPRWPGVLPLLAVGLTVATLIGVIAVL
jgi:membrane protease YdiL (CAAX protease family)